MARILVVDDNVPLSLMLESGLKQEGHEVRLAHSGPAAVDTVKAERPDLIVLDIMLPGMTGLEVCRQLRNIPAYESIPIIFLTARNMLEDKIKGFEVGADDYLPKPFEFLELAVRVRALLRRVNFSPSEEQPRFLEVGDLKLDRERYQVTVLDRTVSLTPVEFELLQYFMLHSGETLGTADLLQGVWGYPVGIGNPALVRKHIEKLRGKLEPRPGPPLYIRTISRLGYVLIV
jgi:two-component system, OmpR family, alkaline phosphatase synthesis response regulator PhoP